MLHLAVFALFHAAEDDVQAAAKKALEAGSFAFAVQQGEGKPLAGTWEKGKPLAVTAEGIPFVREGERLVYKDGGKWQKTRTGTLSDPLRILGPSALVRSLVPPHEELVLLSKCARGAKKEDGGWTVALDKESAQLWVPPADRSLARSGSLRIKAKDGTVTGWEVRVRLQGRRGDAEVDGEAARQVRLDKLGKAKAELPEEARKLLE
ncbi:MAG: hypothetical protein K2W96_08620 [Gemmataceae bacterium]|nr:hypothetical protein [Gemmataceae bacterium]